MLRIDFETRGVVDLPKRGVHIYAADDNTEVWCMAYAFGDEPVEIWVAGEVLPNRIAQYVEDGGLVGAWNAAFELAIWNTIMGPRYGWPELRVEQCRCTMMMAAAMSLPLSLDKAAKALRLDVTKDMVGHRIMMRMAKPRKLEPLTWWDRPERTEKLYAYCKQDVEVERLAAGKLRDLSDSEQALWVLDQKINARGVPVDMDSVAWLIDWCESERERLNSRMASVTNGQVNDCTNVGLLAAFAGVASVAAGVMGEHISNSSGAIKEALELRMQYAKTSTKKLEAFQRGTMDDGAMRGIFQFYGAESTGRWSGRRVQPQNFPRPSCSQEEIERRIAERDFASLTEVSDCLRAMICAPEGTEFVCSDFSSIEARVLAWMAGEEGVLDIFKRGGDVYIHAAAGIFKVAEAAVDKSQRQIGKVAILALGYQGAKGAFNSMANAYGVMLPERQVENIVEGWRKANKQIVAWWYNLEETATKAIHNKGKKYTAGPVTLVHKLGHLWVKLPSGRLLCFPRAKIGTVKKPWGDGVGIKYVGENSYTRKVEWLTTYGGKICENIVQAVARDLLAEALVRVEAGGYQVCMHVHDEIVAVGDGLEKFEQIMAEAPAWADGLPLGAEGWQGRRFRK